MIWWWMRGRHDDDDDDDDDHDDDDEDDFNYGSQVTHWGTTRWGCALLVSVNKRWYSQLHFCI